MKQPTPQQLAALRKYARENGRSWKTQLASDWLAGRTEGYLQQVRNQFGPSWLVSFQLSREEKP